MAEPERARWPHQVTAAHPRLRSSLARNHVEFTEASGPRHLVLPATTSVGFVVKLGDSAHRPPAFVMGSHRAHTVLDGACAPAYMELWLPGAGPTAAGGSCSTTR